MKGLDKQIIKSNIPAEDPKSKKYHDLKSPQLPQKEASTLIAF